MRTNVSWRPHIEVEPEEFQGTLADSLSEACDPPALWCLSKFLEMSRFVSFLRAPSEARVLVVTSGWPRDDAPVYGIFIRRQVESLAKEGVDADVLVINGYRSPIAYVAAALVLARANLKRRRYVLVHAHGGEAAFAARFYIRAPVLASYMGDDLLGTPRADGSVPLRSRARRSLIRQFARLMSATVTKSAGLERVLPSTVRNRNRVLPNGVDQYLFSPIPRSEARRELGWPDSERVALFVGDPAIPVKRYWLAEAACAEAHQSIRGLRLHVATTVAPDRIPIFMGAADCLLLTSSSEGSPNVVKEALMMNLPVVATSVGDVEELLDGVEPSFVSDATPAALAAALVECLHRPRRSNGRSRSGRLSSSAVARSLRELYERHGLPPSSEPERDGAWDLPAE